MLYDLYIWIIYKIYPGTNTKNDVNTKLTEYEYIGDIESIGDRGNIETMKTIENIEKIYCSICQKHINKNMEIHCILNNIYCSVSCRNYFITNNQELFLHLTSC